MFGDSNATNKTDEDEAVTAPNLGLGSNPAAAGPVAPSDDASAPAGGFGSDSNSDSSSSGSGSISEPAAPPADVIEPTAPAEDTPPVTDTPEPDPSPSSSPSFSPTQDGGNDKLATIKKQALEQLSPLVHKLDQTPEEKYKTLMMMVQATDNQDLLSEAYQAAQEITDEKAKAEALLSVVNEVDYFTHGSGNSSTES